MGRTCNLSLPHLSHPAVLGVTWRDSFGPASRPFTPAPGVLLARAMLRSRSSVLPAPISVCYLWPDLNLGALTQPMRVATDASLDFQVSSSAFYWSDPGFTTQYHTGPSTRARQGAKLDLIRLQTAFLSVTIISIEQRNFLNSGSHNSTDRVLAGRIVFGNC
ncbi:hypothetical protein ElyMa_003189400 [Elysia marginata]|uniref:Uncharacterized protein n=1 Tax=Elysia marginata TaxID=1093978 RepID=A0AAV4J249_9GAST|nr:hypothetical protein ElyMa_003189400 [Elysia marginata]